MATKRRTLAKIVFVMFAVGCTMVEGFHFVAPLPTSLLNERQAALPGCGTSAGGKETHVHKGEVAMRGLHKKGKNGPGLTGVQRVINTRERVSRVDDPCKVMISNLDYSLTEDDVRVFCRSAGPVASVKLVKRRYARTSRGFGFVEFDQPLTATIAIEDLSGREFHGRVVELKPAVTSLEKKRDEAKREWEERLALERESPTVDDYHEDSIVDDVKVEKSEGTETNVNAARQSEKKSMPSAEQFLEMVGRRTKPKPPVPTNPELD